MKYLIFTDAHYGWWNSRAPPIQSVINDANKHHDIDKIINLGDVVDLWRRRLDDVILEQHENISRLCEDDCINIRGNHDFILDEVYPDYKSHEHHVDVDIHYIHGYQLEIMSHSTPFTKESYERIARLLCYTNNTMGGLFSIAWNNMVDIINLLRSGHKCDDGRLELYTRFADKIYKNVFFGHFHRSCNIGGAHGLRALCDGYYYILDTNNGDIAEYNYYHQ
jgi:predicted phosphodiesterase